MNVAEISFIVIMGVLIFFYLTIVRPGQKEQQRVRDTIRDLQIGDEVITTSGFFAHVKEIHTPETGPVQIVLDLGNGIEIRARTTAISERISKANAPAEQEHKSKGA